MPVRFRLSRDGKVSVKVPGMRRQVYEVPFLDRYRRRAFRNLRIVLERLQMRIVGEETVKRFVNVSYEEKGTIRDYKLPVMDKVLHVIFNPSSELRRICPSLNGNYRMAFRYEGRGIFEAYPIGELTEDEEKEFEKLVSHVIKPQYKAAFIIDLALQMKLNRKEGEDEEKSCSQDLTPEQNIDEGRSEENCRLEEQPMPVNRKGRKNAGLRCEIAADSEVPNRAEEMLTIEEIKERIRRFQPEGLKENLAYNRYLQALSYDTESEEEIHRLFYTHIIRKRDFESFYRRLYMYVPSLLENGRVISKPSRRRIRPA